MRVYSGVASSVLSTLGKLSMICGEDMIRYLDGLIPLIIGTLQDKASSIKRQVALRTLGQLVSSTGYVIEPCIKYPTLLPTVLNVLKGERSMPLRIEVMKVLGVIGALDPYKYRATQGGPAYGKAGRGVQAAAAAHAAAAAAAGTIGGTDEKRGTTNGVGPGGVGGTLGARTQANTGAAAAAAADGTDGKGDAVNNDANNVSMVQATEDYYPTVAIASLMRVLRDPGLSANHTMVIKAVMFIFK
jgi:FKBP12-rapamycin complex-associated protein